MWNPNCGNAWRCWITHHRAYLPVLSAGCGILLWQQSDVFRNCLKSSDPTMPCCCTSWAQLKHRTRWVESCTTVQDPFFEYWKGQVRTIMQSGNCISSKLPTVRHLPCVPSHLQVACFQHPRHWQGSQMCENMTKYGLGISAPFPTWANSFIASPSKRIRPVRLTMRSGAICTGAHGFFGAQLGLRKDIVLVTPRSTNFAAKNIVKPGSTCLWTANSDDCCTSMISMSSPMYASKCIWLLLQQSGAKACQELVYLIQPSTKSCTLCGIHSYSCFFYIHVFLNDCECIPVKVVCSKLNVQSKELLKILSRALKRWANI